jgi:hypothetical protein
LSRSESNFRFLFESKAGTILYTGDIRFEDEYYVDSNLNETFSFLRGKRIDRIFLDATFCDPFFQQFPTRRHSIDVILKFIKEAKPGPIYLAFDMLGTEPILISIAKTFNTKLYIDRDSHSTNRFKEILNLEFLTPFLTKKKESTRFRIVSYKMLQEMSELLKDDPDKPLMIRGTTMWLKQEYENSIGISNIRSHFTKPKILPSGIYQFIFSIHNSLDELKRFVLSIGNNIPITPLRHNNASIGRGVDVHKYFSKNKTIQRSPLSFETSFKCLHEPFSPTFRFSFHEYQDATIMPSSELVSTSFSDNHSEDESIVLSLDSQNTSDNEKEPLLENKLKRNRDSASCTDHDRKRVRL